MIAHSGYSSKVALTLLIDGVSLALSHVGSRFIVVRDPCEPILPSYGEIVIEVNGSRQHHKVLLHRGISEPGQIVDYKPEMLPSDEHLALVRRLQSWPNVATLSR